MSLELCADPSPAAWITSSELPWNRLVVMGPSGFEAYARLRFIPDPAYPGQSENDVTRVSGLPSEHEQMQPAISVLRGHTDTPDEVYYCIWEGFGWSPPGGAPTVRLPGRAYFLFRGTVSDFRTAWAVEDLTAPWGTGVTPAVVWPADHAWCVAKDVDPHFAGIGGSAAAVAQLLETPGLDVVRADPAAEQPFYR